MNFFFSQLSMTFFFILLFSPLGFLFLYLSRSPLSPLCLSFGIAAFLMLGVSESSGYVQIENRGLRIGSER